MNVEVLEKFHKSALRAFFNESDLISHQINSFSEVIGCGDCSIRIVVKLSYDPLKKRGGSWRHVTITYGKVRTVKSSFWIKRGYREEECLILLSKHARLQNPILSN